MSRGAGSRERRGGGGGFAGIHLFTVNHLRSEAQVVVSNLSDYLPISGQSVVFHRGWSKRLRFYLIDHNLRLTKPILLSARAYA